MLLPEGTSAKLNGKPLSKGKQTFVFEDVYTEYDLQGDKGDYQVEFSDVTFQTPVYLSGDFEAKYSTVNDFHQPLNTHYAMRVFAPEKERLQLFCKKSCLASGSWTEQGHPFYSGKATYQCDFTSDFPADYLELVLEGVLCEVALDGVSLGRKAMSPYLFPLKQCQTGHHVLTVSITNTLGNQLEQFRVPSGLMGGKLLETAISDISKRGTV